MRGSLIGSPVRKESSHGCTEEEIDAEQGGQSPGREEHLFSQLFELP